MKPSVSVVFVTGGRRLFARQAVEYFSRFAYQGPHELLVVAGGTGPPDRTLGSGQHLPDVRWLRQPHKNLPSALRELKRFRVYDEPVPLYGPAQQKALELATGDIVVHMDDDDFYGPGYLDMIVSKLSTCDATGLRQFHSYEILRGEASLIGPNRAPWGGTQAYWRKFGLSVGFKPLQPGHDIQFWLDCEHASSSLSFIEILSKEYVYIRHGLNTTGTAKLGARAEVGPVLDALGPNVEFYRGMAELLNTRNTAARAIMGLPLVDQSPAWHVPLLLRHVLK